MKNIFFYKFPCIVVSSKSLIASKGHSVELLPLTALWEFYRYDLIFSNNQYVEQWESTGAIIGWNEIKKKRMLKREQKVCEWYINWNESDRQWDERKWRNTMRNRYKGSRTK